MTASDKSDSVTQGKSQRLSGPTYSTHCDHSSDSDEKLIESETAVLLLLSS